MDEARARGIRVGLQTPLVTLDREWADARWLLDRLASRLDIVLVHHHGSLQLATRLCPDARIIADHGFNLLNSAAISLLAEEGVDQAVVSHEAGLEDLRLLADASPLPLEIVAHGPMTGMLVDHCLIALHASSSGRKDVCRGPCRHVTFGLRDRAGQVRAVVADQYCRNHLLTGHDLATLPVLEKLLFDRVGSIRLVGTFDPPEVVAAMTRAYRTRLEQIQCGRMNGTGWHDAWIALQQVSPRPLNLGPYPRSVIASRSTVAVMKGMTRT
jgi:putative protease